jgi:L-seryl-tRNA(Ser) seleniumtransferase
MRATSQLETYQAADAFDLAGRADPIVAARANGSPNAGIGRGMKVSKKAMAGLWKAIELFMATDHAAEHRANLAQAEALVAGLDGCIGARLWIESDWERWPAPVDAAWNPKAIQTALRSGEPSIHVDIHSGCVQISIHCLQAGEKAIIAHRLRAPRWMSDAAANEPWEATLCRN